MKRQCYLSLKKSEFCVSVCQCVCVGGGDTNLGTRGGQKRMSDVPDLESQAL